MEPFYLQLAGGIGALLFLSIAVFEVLLALGLPLGEAAWGGTHRILPRNLRIASAVAAPIWVGAALVLAEQGRVTSFGMDATLTKVVLWILTAFLALGIVMNFMSRSKRERLIMTPVAATGFLLCLFLSLFS